MVSETDPSAAVKQRHLNVASDVLPEHTGLYIGGEFVSSAADDTFETVDPTTGQVLADVGRGRAEDIDRAV